MELTRKQTQAVEACMKDCVEATSRLVAAVDGLDGSQVGQMLTAAMAMAAGQSLPRMLTACRVPDELHAPLMEHFSEELKARLLAYVDSPLYWQHRTGSPVKPPAAPALRREPVTFWVEDGWQFQPRSINGPSDGVAFHPDKPKKGRHDAFGLGGVVICSAWKKPRRILGRWRAESHA